MNFKKDDCLARHCNLLIILYSEELYRMHTNNAENKLKQRTKYNLTTQSTTHQTKKRRKKQLPKISTKQEQSKTQLNFHRTNKDQMQWQRHSNQHKGTYLGFVWLEEWKSGRIENGEMMEKQEDRKNFNFSHFCLVDSEKVEGYKI